MAGNTVTLEFAGDARKLEQAAQRASRATESVGTSATSAGDDFNRAAQGATDYTRQMGNAGEATTGALDAIDALGGGLQAVADISDYARERAQRLARASVDVMQAQEDLNQAYRDGKQAAIDADQAALDLTQARLDEKTALEAYNDAVKEHGRSSDEAKQAQIDLKQAGIDVKQALEDQQQATRDASQANIDAKTAQVDLNDAMHEANPPEIQGWADKVSMVTPLLSALVGVVGLVTAAQWAWNIAQMASPTTWIIAGIVALVAVVVLVATKTEWGRKVWESAWGGMKRAASAVSSWFTGTAWPAIRRAWDGIRDAGQRVWNWMRDLPGKIKSAFSRVTSFIAAPFKSAFNQVARAWNATIGRLSWTVPGWVPGVGGNSISAPSLPTFHSGGVVPGVPGSNQLALLQAGERVLPATSSGGQGSADWIRVDLGELGDALVSAISKSVRNRHGGRIEALGVKVATR